MAGILVLIIDFLKTRARVTPIATAAKWQPRVDYRGRRAQVTLLPSVFVSCYVTPRSSSIITEPRFHEMIGANILDNSLKSRIIEPDLRPDMHTPRPV